MLKEGYWKFDWLMLVRSLIGFCLLVSCCYQIENGFGLKMCKTGFDPYFKKSEIAHF